MYVAFGHCIHAMHRLAEHSPALCVLFPVSTTTHKVTPLFLLQKECSVHKLRAVDPDLQANPALRFRLGSSILSASLETYSSTWGPVMPPSQRCCATAATTQKALNSGPKQHAGFNRTHLCHMHVMPKLPFATVQLQCGKLSRLAVCST